MGNLTSFIGRLIFQTDQMTGDMHGTGVITMTSKELCVVSVNINGTPKALSFGKRLFYFWGIQCEGDMVNILEENMEVNVCYTFSESEDKPSVVAVWIGDKPELLNSDESLVDVYNQMGYVADILGDGSYIVFCDCMKGTVVVNKDVMYRDGRRIDGSRYSFIIDECVRFDAIPFEFEHFSGAMYKATCAWTGKEPRLVDRFSMNVMDSVEQKLNAIGMNPVYGTVVVIPNDAVAFVEIEDAREKVMLFRSSFNPGCESLHDVVTVADRLCMRLSSAYIFEGCRQWFAVKACKMGEEGSEGVLISEPEEICPQTVESIVELKSATKYFVDYSEECNGDGCKISGNSPSKAQLPLSFDVNSDILYSEPSLSGVIYTKKFDEDHAVINFMGCCIYVNICDVYIDGLPCTRDKFCSLVKPGKNDVNFEAVLYRMSAFKTKFSHYATCVWLGEKPPLWVVASSVWDSDKSILRFKDEKFVGKVENFYFPDVALLSIQAQKKSLVSVVCLYKDEFDCESEHSAKRESPNNYCISKFVKIQSYVEFKVRQNDKCPLGLCAYDVKKSTELAAAEWKAKFVQMLKNEETTTSEMVDTSAAIAFNPDYSLAKRSLFLNGVGTFVLDKKTQSSKIDHRFGSSVLEASSQYQPLREFDGQKVRFDAEFVQSSATSRLYVKRVWGPETLKPSAESNVLSRFVPTTLVDFKPNQLYCGRITSIPLHDGAVAVVDGVPVLVMFESIVTSREVDPNFYSIEVFFSVGDHVGLKLVQEKTKGTYYKATACYKLEGKPFGPDAKVEVTALNELSWRGVWESGEYFGTGRVEKRDGNYFVNFVSSKRPDTKMSLDLSGVHKAGKLFVDGKPKSDSLNCLKDRDISFHVACKDRGNGPNGSEEMYIEWAWLGNYPLLPTLLKSQTAALGGLISPDWFYEGVVEDFPLPTYAICRVGFLSVLLPLQPIKQDGAIVGVVESDLKKGHKVVLSISEQFSVRQTMLISRLCTSVVRMYEESEVLVVVRGVVAELPQPRGRIKMYGSPIDVWFDRSCVVAVNGICKKGNIFEWIAYVDASIDVGTEVYFSAAKDLTWNKWYRAYEVRVGKWPEWQRYC